MTISIIRVITLLTLLFNTKSHIKYALLTRNSNIIYVNIIQHEYKAQIM